MEPIHKYNFHKTKYGGELLIDVVTLDGIRRYIDQHPVHVLSYFDITFVSKGPGRIAIDHTPHPLGPGDVVFSRPGQIRAWDKVPQGWALIFEEEFLLSFFNDGSFVRNLSYFNSGRAPAKMNVSRIRPRLGRLIRSIVDEINNEESKDKHILRALLYEMLTLLSREYARSLPPDEEKPRSRHADGFIELADRHFKTCRDMRYYAGELCITPNYLNEIVRKSIGVSPKRYIQDKIIREAKTLLAYTGLSVSEVAESLGFENASYFTRLFREQTTLTPLEYRRNAGR